MEIQNMIAQQLMQYKQELQHTIVQLTPQSEEDETLKQELLQRVEQVGLRLERRMQENQELELMKAALNTMLAPILAFLMVKERDHPELKEKIDYIGKAYQDKGFGRDFQAIKASAKEMARFLEEDAKEAGELDGTVKTTEAADGEPSDGGNEDAVEGS